MKSNKENKSINIIDRVCQNASQVADRVNVDISKKKRLWDNISQRLSDLDKRVLTWFLAMTTSFSLLIAGGIELWKNTPEVIPTQRELTLQVKTIDTSEPIESFEHALTSELKAKKQPSSINSPIPTTTILKGTEIIQTKQPEIPKESHKALQNIKPQIYLGTTLSTAGLTPELGIDVPVYTKSTGKHTHSIKTGISAQFLLFGQRKATEGEQQVNNTAMPSVFANLLYEIKDNSKNSTWSARIGYRLNNNNNDTSIYSNHTMKASLHKSINNHIKIGPEVIFTNNFRKVYPGIGLVVSS
ncbi:hypothetical protein [Reichenbachiella sp. MSK19-1]|uniref:hypothetical protein n=1 Tax=Reichenbachiella sp. MSK19-1 TaxID=1897631 RepID=UPI000E6CBDA3|nr:hypothetical protein [Reichenbachiella sp. MSK19-1]RJE75006.1 hypothetical protein BGP76_17990 [Reichenbachiella sp. MSK19-1]